jgi:hypothetical protein
MSVAQRQSDEKNERMPGPANLKKKEKKEKNVYALCMCIHTCRRRCGPFSLHSHTSNDWPESRARNAFTNFLK